MTVDPQPVSSRPVTSCRSSVLLPEPVEPTTARCRSRVASRDRQRALAVRADDDRICRPLRRWQGAGQRARPGQLGGVERLVGQVPQLGDLPVGELRSGRARDRAADDLPTDLLAGVGQRVGRVGQVATAAPWPPRSRSPRPRAGGRSRSPRRPAAFAPGRRARGRSAGLAPPGPSPTRGTGTRRRSPRRRARRSSASPTARGRRPARQASGGTGRR